MDWPKDRKKAFLWAAKAFGTPYERRTEKQRELTESGFCFAISILTRSNKIYSWSEGFWGSLIHWWPCIDFKGWTSRYDKERSLFCYQMAALSHKEFEELQA